jgi:glycosyltransferase involved in cell wall biosynthesis
MRISILTYAPSGWGGTEVNTIGFARALVTEGHDVTLVQLGHHEYRDRVVAGDGIVLKDVELPARLHDVTFAWWRRLLGSLKPDIFALSKGGFEIRSTRLDLVARLAARKYVLLEHHPAAPLPPRTSTRHLGGLIGGMGIWWWREFLPRWFHLWLADRVITDSEHVTSILASSFHLDRAKTFCVHPGIDPDQIAYRDRAGSELRSEWGIPSDALVLGSVGRLAPVKALDRTLYAFAALKAQGSERPCWLVIAGDGPDRESLGKLAEELGIAGHVAFPGYVRDAADALSALDVFLMPSREEGFGIALLEAMACERVCVAMNSGGPGEILADDSLGWLTPPDDQEAFVEALRRAMLLDANERRVMGAKARAHVIANFSRETQMRRLARLIVEA